MVCTSHSNTLYLVACCSLIYKFQGVSRVFFLSCPQEENPTRLYLYLSGKLIKEVFGMVCLLSHITYYHRLNMLDDGVPGSKI